MKDYDLQEVLLPLKMPFGPLSKVDEKQAETEQLDEEKEEKEKKAKPYEGPYNNIFVTKDWQTCEKLMLLIQGTLFFSFD